jgi:hypothetical protein
MYRRQLVRGEVPDGRSFPRPQTGGSDAPHVWAAQFGEEEAVIRHWVITDADGRNPRHVTLEEYVEALERGERILIDSIVDRHIVRPAPPTLAEAAQALANC